MERLMLLQLQAQGCGAEAWMNGLPVARLAPGQASMSVAVHEYAFSGANRFALVLSPETTLPATAPTAQALSASLHLLLPRMGAPVDAHQARTLAQLDVLLAAGDATPLPLSKPLDVSLPVNFPRWRWTEAPLLDPTPAVQQAVLAFIITLMQDLSRGQTASFMAATRLRTEELALAYQREPAAETARLQAWLDGVHAAGRLVWQPLPPQALVLRPVADGRLLECLHTDGGPALRTAPDPDGNIIALPLRLAMANGSIHVLR